MLESSDSSSFEDLGSSSSDASRSEEEKVFLKLQKKEKKKQKIKLAKTLGNINAKSTRASS